MASVFFDPAVGGDGSTVTDDANPSTGLSNGGHRTRFVPALQQTVAVAANAKNSASAAAASAASALNAPGTSATSTDAITIGSGSKSLTIQTGKAFVPGMYLLLSATAGVWMLGAVSSYNSATGALVVAVGMYQGSGSYSAWTVTPTSPINPSTVIYALGYTPGGLGIANHWTAGNDFDYSPNVPTPAAGDNSSKAINSAWYLLKAGSVNGSALGAASAGTSSKWAREDHVHPVDVSTITGDFSAIPVSGRRRVVTSVANGGTGLFIHPNGNASAAGLAVANKSDVDNSSTLSMVASSVDTQLVSGKQGSGAYLPIRLNTSGVNQWEIDTSGRLRNIGNSQPHLTINKAAGGLAQESGTNVVFDTVIAQRGGAAINGDNATYSTPVDGVYAITARVLILNAGSAQYVEMWLKAVHASLTYSDAQIVGQQVSGGGWFQEFSFAVTRWLPAGTAITLTRPYGVAFNLNIKVTFASLSITLLG